MSARGRGGANRSDQGADISTNSPRLQLVVFERLVRSTGKQQAGDARRDRVWSGLGGAQWRHGLPREFAFADCPGGLFFYLRRGVQVLCARRCYCCALPRKGGERWAASPTPYISVFDHLVRNCPLSSVFLIAWILLCFLLPSSRIRVRSFRSSLIS